MAAVMDEVLAVSSLETAVEVNTRIHVLKGRWRSGSANCMGDLDDKSHANNGVQIRDCLKMAVNVWLRG